MDFDGLYHFLFETYAGIGCLVGAGLIISLVVSAILEKRTRKAFANRELNEKDWTFFDNEDEKDR